MKWKHLSLWGMGCCVMVWGCLLDTPSAVARVNSSALNVITHNVIQCESGGNPNAVGDGGKAYGILQFHKDTFNWLKIKSGMLSLQYTSPADQIILFQWAVRHGWGHLWSCYRKLYGK